MFLCVGFIFWKNDWEFLYVLDKFIVSDIMCNILDKNLKLKSIWIEKKMVILNINMFGIFSRMVNIYLLI